jgi:molybdopterin-containing oxidoreductase family iron-sulfur binding subunit
VIVAADADPLLTEGNAVRAARGFAERRRVASNADEMNRLWVVETQLSLTGANADHRVAIKRSLIPVFMTWLAYLLSRRGLSIEAPSSPPAHVPGLDRAWMEQMADDLLAHRGRSLVLAGERQPPNVQALALRMNSALGNVGTTLTFAPLDEAARPSTPALADLTEAMRAGQVQTLVVLGGNPVYDAPADLGFRDALARVANVVAAVDSPNETSSLAGWQVPLAHPLESWGDARASDGTLSVIQPLVEPLYGARSDVELLSLLASGETRSGHEIVQETWRARLGQDDFERRFSRLLHDGLLDEGGAAPLELATRPVTDELFRHAERVMGSPARTELVFVTSARMADGRHADNGWLQELPDPITKLTWENAALLAPATASELGVGREDLVRLTAGEQTLELPVLVVPGQAEDTVVVELGWGREVAGRVGRGRGVDLYPWRTTAAPSFFNGVTLAAGGGRRTLATTQDHHLVDELGQREREARRSRLIRETTLADYRRNPEFVHEHETPHPPLDSLWDEQAYDRGPQWGMSIDLNVCTGCSACVLACQAENNVPIVGPEQVSRGREMHWLRVDRYWSGSPESPSAVFQPIPCMQCENAPCEQVCPVTATVHDAEGLNAMVYNRCIGTRYCSNNCPYKVRRFNYFNYTKDTPASLQLAYNPDVTVRSRGVMEKCTYCTQRINAAKIEAKLAGRALADGDVRTACQQACPTNAISFGNLHDASAEVVRRKAQDRDYTLLAEMNNKPRTTYLAKLRNPLAEGEA